MPDSAVDDTDIPGELLELLQLTERREPVVVEIAVWVTSGVINGSLKPGQTLNSVDIATRFGSSRTPVREALAILESVGLIEMRARKRARVASFDQATAREIFFLRAHLMASLAPLAVEKATVEDLRELGRHVAELRLHAAAGDEPHYRWAHFRFFALIVDLSGNETAKGILNSLFLRTLSVRRALADADRLAESLDFAVLLLSAFERRDGELAALLVRRSIEAAAQALERV